MHARVPDHYPPYPFQTVSLGGWVNRALLSASSRREIGEQDHSGVEACHVRELHPNGSPVAEHVDVSLAPHERVQVDLVLVDQAPLREGVRDLAAPVPAKVTVDFVLKLRDPLLD